MKIPCVRCGKDIEAPSVYCKDCERVMSGEGPSASSSYEDTPPDIHTAGEKTKFPLKLVSGIILLLLCIAGVFYFLNKNKNSPPEQAKAPAEITIVAEGTPSGESGAGKTAPEELPEDPATLFAQNSTSSESNNTNAEVALQPEQPVEAADSETPPPPVEEIPKTLQPEIADNANIAEFNSTASLPEALPEQIAEAPETPTPLPTPQETNNSSAANDAGETPQPGALISDNNLPDTTLPGTPLPEAQTGAEDNASQPGGDEIVFDDAPAQDNATAENPEIVTPPAVEEQPLEQGQANATEETPAAPQPVYTEQGVKIYNLGREGLDKELAKHLKEKGYVNVQAMGKWSGHFNDKNVFYRHEDGRGLKQLMGSLPASDFFDYYYDSERIGQSVKGIFKRNDDVDYLIIVK